MHKKNVSNWMWVILFVRIKSSMSRTRIIESAGGTNIIAHLRMRS